MIPAVALLVIGAILVRSGWLNLDVASAALGEGSSGSSGGTDSASSSPGATGTSIPTAPGFGSFPLPRGSFKIGSLDQGVDIAAPAHTPLLAIGDGTIIGHGINGFGQWAPILRLNTGQDVYYGHAGPGNFTPVGSQVKAGSVIGEVGAGRVGISSGPHLEIGSWNPKANAPSGTQTARGMLDYLKSLL